MEKYIIDERIFTHKFSCDVIKCKGACCTLKGAGGAPIMDEEVSVINKNVKTVKKYLEKVNVDILESEGYLEGEKGNYSIKSINDEECIFALYEDGIAKCSFQKSFNSKETDFKKPLSCHLFPIRISGKDRNVIRYEEISECNSAIIKGEIENITIFEFSKDSLVREYGRNFYNDLKEQFSNNI